MVAGDQPMDAQVAAQQVKSQFYQVFNSAGEHAQLTDVFRGCAAFLLCGGPSLASTDLSQLNQRGILTCSVNNAAALFRTQLWASVDPPHRFCEGIWRDPGVMKFTAEKNLDQPISTRKPDGEIILTDERVGEMPNVFAVQLHSGFDPDVMLAEPGFTWGNDGATVDELGNSGVRSVMFVALKLLYVLGVRKVYLLGCDFRMSYVRSSYAFAQDRPRRAVRSNNRSYRVLAARLAALRPVFEAANFHVFNCTPDSALEVFPAVEFDHAVADALAALPGDLNTDGLYDIRSRDEFSGSTIQESRS